MWIPLVFPSIMLAKPKGNESTGHALFFIKDTFRHILL